jgi:hypothetical protein
MQRLNNEELRNLYASPHIRGDQGKEEEVVETCSTHGIEEKCMQNFGQKILREEMPWKT